MVFFFNSIYAQVFLNAYYLLRIGKKKRMPKGLKFFLVAIFLIEILIYSTGYFFREHLPFEYFALIQKINVFWVLSLLYFLFLLCIFDLIFFLNKKWVFGVRFKSGLLFSLFGLATAGFFAFFGMKLEMAKDDYVRPEIKEIPISLQADSVKGSYKLLVASDLHLGYTINRPVLEKYVDLINQEKPDIVVIVGDLIDYYLEPLVEERCDEVLRRLNPPQGAYFVPGNHEYKLNIDANLAWIRKAGLTVLKDSVVAIDDNLYLIGWDDKENEENRASLDNLVKKSPSLERTILFAHQPQDITEAYRLQIPLTVSGHTHNGQVFPGNLGKHLSDNFYGLHENGKSISYTSSGIGLTGFPVKLMTRSEIVVFNIEIK